jgi:tetratricopeptide (TPR) repeat protein
MSAQRILLTTEPAFAPQFRRFIRLRAVGLLLIIGLALSAPTHTSAQKTESGERERAFQLWDQNHHTEAAPLLEKLALANPSDVEVLARLGFSLYATTATMKDPAERKKRRDYALAVLQRARELGDNSNLSQIVLDVLSSPDTTDIPFSDLREADAAMREGEAAFVQGDLDKALAAYERALKFDPKLYWATVFAGDMHFRKGIAAADARLKKEELDKAGEWFARAIAIDADRETAYRYWGDALMRQQKMDEARTKFIEAIIAEPYNERGYVGLTQWAEHNRIKLGHPKINQPDASMRSSTEGGQTTIIIDPKKLDPSSGPSYYWSFYDLTRATWGKANFSKEYPNEKTYRHSLKEEVAALRLVAETASRDLKSGKVKSLDSSLDNLIKLHEAGLIDAYVLFVRPDKGIVQDYIEYRKANRDKLRRYWAEFVVVSK